MQDHLDSTAYSENRAEQRDRLWSLIKDIRFAMFTSQDENGHLHAWPMTTQNKTIDEENSLWFFMSLRSDPVNNIEDDPVVNVSYADPSSDSYVSVSGIDYSKRHCKSSAIVVKDGGSMVPHRTK
jgi:general stress protein 26